MQKPVKEASTRGGVPALERSPSHLLHRALQLALDVYGAESGPDALTQRQFAVLAAVEAHDGPTQTDLVRATGIDRSTLADMIARMTAKGVLARERSTLDARANVVRLTPEGRAALLATQPKAAAADARILSALGASKRDPFVAALRALARAGERALLGEEVKLDQDDESKTGKAAKKAARAEKSDRPSKKKRRKLKKAKTHEQDGLATQEPSAVTPG